MKMFKRLTIFCDEYQLDDLIKTVDQSLSGGWSRTPNDKLNDDPLSDKHLKFAYDCSPTEARESARIIFFYDKEKFRLDDINIVPQEIRELGKEKANYILDEFFLEFLKNPIGQVGLKYSLSDSEISLPDTMPKEVKDKLLLFVNTETALSGHPLDEERWCQFIIAAHQNDLSLDSSYLREWMSEDLEWPENYAIKFSREYAFARSVLKEYDKALAKYSVA